MTQALLLCVVLCLIRGLYLRILVERHEVIYFKTNGVLTTELRRRVHLVAHADGMGGLTFPKPRETRTLVHGVAGFPAWHEAQSVGLPPQVEVMINAVTAREFDAHFSMRFRCEAVKAVGPMVDSFRNCLNRRVLCILDTPDAGARAAQ